MSGSDSDLACADRITINDVRNAGHCVSGTRLWFDRHGLDFRDFIKNGISEQEFLAFGDGLALDVVIRKRGVLAWVKRSRK